MVSDDRNVFFHSSGSWKPEIKESACCFFSECPEEKSALGLPLSFSDWLADSWHCPLAFRSITSISVSSSCIFTVISLLLEGHIVITLDEKAILLHFRTSLVAQLVKKICLQCGRSWFNSWVKKIPWKRDRLTILVFLGFPSGSDGKESTCSVGDLGSIPGLKIQGIQSNPWIGRSPAEGHGNPLQYSCLKKSPWTEEPGGLQSMGLQGVVHD